MYDVHCMLYNVLNTLHLYIVGLPEVGQQSGRFFSGLVFRLDRIVTENCGQEGQGRTGHSTVVTPVYLTGAFVDINRLHGIH